MDMKIPTWWGGWLPGSRTLSAGFGDRRPTSGEAIGRGLDLHQLFPTRGGGAILLSFRRLPVHRVAVRAALTRGHKKCRNLDGAASIGYNYIPEKSYHGFFMVQPFGGIRGVVLDLRLGIGCFCLGCICIGGRGLGFWQRFFVLICLLLLGCGCRG